MKQNDYFVVLDDAHTHVCHYYQNFAGFDVIQASEVTQIDALLKQGWDKGLYVVLWMPFDFGHDLMFSTEEAAMYLLWFTHREQLHDDAETLPWQQTHNTPTGVASLHNTVTEADYLQHIDAIHAAITRGEVYQINYTTQWQGEVYGEPCRLYQRLRERQQVPYGVLAHLPAAVNGGSSWHLGFSPELFLDIREDGVVRTKPMKGTAPILQDGLDQQRAETLRNDAKNRAENVMIVDLLRNDLGKLAITGGVSVPQAFEVTAFGSVWQMTSTVEAVMRPETTVADILKAAFPCGSITGAPKRMAMRLIQDLEQRKRGLYTGSVGFLEPCEGGLGFKGVWNVVIRSLNLRQRAEYSYDLEMGIGSGIVIDSDRNGEWDECGWKARFVRGLGAEVGLIETMRVENGVCALLPLHQQRLHQSLRDLQIACDEEGLWQSLQDACRTQYAQGVWRVKCEVNAEGVFSFTAAALTQLKGAQFVQVASGEFSNRDVLRRYKTTHRQQFDAVWQQAERQGAFDGLMFNQAGYLLEGGRSNVFIQINGQWYTPALGLDILNGVMRQAILAQPEQYGFVGGVVESEEISLSMLQQTTRICLSNALRGVIEVSLQ